MKLLSTGPSPRGWHRLQLMLECPQKWAYKFLLGDKESKTTSVPLIKGSMMHLVLAHHYLEVKAQQHGIENTEWLDPRSALEEACLNEGESWYIHRDQIWECYQAYKYKWLEEKMRILEVEKLAYTKVNGHVFTGRFDLVYEDRRGKVWICDHKTTGRLQSKQRQFYGISGQLVGYRYLGQQIYGDKFAGMILNQVQHTPPFKFARFQLSPAPHLAQRFPQIVHDAETRINELGASGRKATNYPMAANELTCYSRYGACPHLKKCQWGIETHGE